MNRKKEHILETAMKLFAQKGFHATSMQEIAEQCGIAKGSIYNYFQSKDQLLLSIFQYYFNTFTKKIYSVNREKGLTTREMFQTQLYNQLKEFIHYRDFIRMYMREQMLERNEEIKQFITNMRKEFYQWYRQWLIKLYGEEVRPYALDCAIMIHGMIREYIINMIFDGKQNDLEKLATYISRRIEDLIHGVQQQGEIYFTDDDFKEMQVKEPSLLELISQYRAFIQSLEIPEKMLTQALNALGALEEQLECMETATGKVIIQGLLLYLEHIGMGQGDEMLERIKLKINSL